MNKTKKCLGCERVLPIAMFNRDSQKHDGLRTRCRECRTGAMRAYRAGVRRKRDADTPEIRDAVREMWNDGATISEMARAIDRSRSTVRSLIQTMKLPARDNGTVGDLPPSGQYVSEAMAEMNDPIRRRLRLLALARQACRIWQEAGI